MITRTMAKALYSERLGVITDQELEAFMDDYLRPRLYNCLIVDDCVDNDDNEI
jgi:hypothetical protein